MLQKKQQNSVQHKLQGFKNGKQSVIQDGKQETKGETFLWQTKDKANVNKEESKQHSDNLEEEIESFHTRGSQKILGIK